MFRSLLLRLSASLLPVTLFGFGLALSLMLVFGNPTLIKSAVRDSGLYNVLVDDMFLQNQAILGTAIPVQDSGIRKAVESAITPQLLQSSGDHIIDGTYGWLQGKTTTPQFNVDLTAAKAQAAENVATYVANRTVNLPLCSLGQTQAIYSSGINLYNLTCRPQGLTTTDIHDMVRGSLTTSNNFFSDAFITAGSIKDTSGQPLYSRLSFIPTLYQWTIASVYVLGAVALAALAGVTFLSRPRRTGVKRVGFTLLGVGGVSLFFSIVFGYLSKYISDGITKVSGSTEALQVKLTDIVHIVITDVRYWWIRIAILELIIGVGALLWLRLRPQSSAAASAATPLDVRTEQAPQNPLTPQDQRPWDGQPPQTPRIQ